MHAVLQRLANDGQPSKVLASESSAHVPKAPIVQMKQGCWHVFS